ncbi:MAG: alpha/beta hydrolase [Parvularculaceae bacterium]
MTKASEIIDGPNGRLACRRRAGAGPGVVWLGGFKSDMLGTKAGFLDQWAAEKGRAFLRFDYSGHGESEGAFEDGSISRWTADAVAVFDAMTEGPQILVGSSMGAWIATLLALKRPERIAGIIFIAPAPDFTEDLIWAGMSETERETLMRDGRLEQPSDYDEEPYVITRKLIEDGRRNLMLGGPIAITAPVRVLQGMADPDVPWRHAMRYVEALESDDVTVALTKTGDHRLSTPADLDRLAATLDCLSKS